MTIKEQLLKDISDEHPQQAMYLAIALACIGIYDITQAYVKSLETANKALEELQKR